MGPETYSQTSNNRTLVWDVARLIKLAESLPVVDVPISEIKQFDQVMWFGGPRGVQPTCREVTDHARRIQKADLTRPIILGADGRVMDGMHRVAKAWMEGHQHVKAVRFSIDPEPDEVRITS